MVWASVLEQTRGGRNITSLATMPHTKEKLRRRSQHRRSFTASAMVFEPESQTLLRARTADLGPDGCFIDTLNPFAPNMLVRVRIDKGGATFEAWARVVYSLVSMGMGLVFYSVEPEQLWVLHEWLRAAGGAPLPEITLPAAAAEFPEALASTPDRKKDVYGEALSKLISELMTQGLLSEEKGNAILQTLSRPGK